MMSSASSPRLRRWLEAGSSGRFAGPRVADAALAAVLVVAAALTLAAGAVGDARRAPDLVTVLLVGAGITPYFVRSQAPLPVLVTALVPLLLLIEHGDSVGALGLGAVVLTYTVASRGSRAQSAVAVAVVCAALVLIAVRAPDRFSRPEQVANALLFAGAVIAGGWAKDRRNQLGWARERAELLERDRVRAAAEAVSAERLRIARDLHDVIAHSLGVIAVQAGVGAHVADTQPAEGKAALQAIAETSRDALVEVRSLIGALRAEPGESYLPTPAFADVSRLVDDFQAKGMTVDLQLADGVSPPNQAVGIAVYRILQQALANALVHAPGEPVSVRMVAAAAGETAERRGDNGALVVTVTNSLPAGSTESCLSPGGGHGIIGMRERAMLAGGELTAGRVAGDTFVVTAFFGSAIRRTR